MTTTSTGPLPQSDDNSKLQRASIKAIQALLLNHEDLIFRDERTEDYGVDGSLELEIGSGVTNFRSQVQMKATQSLDPNQDGSLSLSVDTYNLNYLLNGTNPIYILYNRSRDEFWYVWAHEEQKRLDAKYKDWKGQKTIALRFTERLTHASLPTIKEAIQRHGRMHREINDALARSTVSEQIIISINRDSLKIEDSNFAFSVLLASGPALIAAGYPSEVLRWLGILPQAQRELPRIRLVDAYAEYMTGSYLTALGHISKIFLNPNGLEPKDQDFLSALNDACEFNVGCIDGAEYINRAAKRAAEAQGLRKLEAQLEQIRYGLIREQDDARRAQMNLDLTGVVGAIENCPEASDATKLSARIAFLYAEGMDATISAEQDFWMKQMRQNSDIQQDANSIEDSRKILERIAAWQEASSDTLQKAHNLRNPLLIAESLTLKVSVNVFQLTNHEFKAVYAQKPTPIDQKVFDGLFKLVEHGVKLYDECGSIDGALRLKLLWADVLEISGKTHEVKTMASEIHRVATAMRLVTVAKRADDLMQGKTPLMELKKNWNDFVSTDKDISFSAMSDKDTKGFADQIMKSHRLPPDRRACTEQYVFEQREIAKERVTWCRYLAVLDDTGATDISLLYVAPPKRKCICEKHHHQTMRTTTNWQEAVGMMKTSCCATCRDREPKVV